MKCCKLFEGNVLLDSTFLASHQNMEYKFSFFLTRTFYTIKLEVYVGTQSAGPFSIDNKPSSVVKRLIVPIAYSNRNVTIDN